MKRTKMSAILVLRSELLRRVALVLALGLTACPAQVSEAAPMGTAWTYQGRLIDANVAADGEYDFRFRLFDGDAGGSQVGSDVSIDDVNVIDGYFTVELDFGSVFTGEARWLEIGVREGSSSGDFTTLSPRQKITPAPYAISAGIPYGTAPVVTGDFHGDDAFPVDPYPIEVDLSDLGNISASDVTVTASAFKYTGATYEPAFVLWDISDSPLRATLRVYDKNGTEYDQGDADWTGTELRLSFIAAGSGGGVLSGGNVLSGKFEYTVNNTPTMPFEIPISGFDVDDVNSINVVASGIRHAGPATVTTPLAVKSAVVDSSGLKLNLWVWDIYGDEPDDNNPAWYGKIIEVSYSIIGPAGGVSAGTAGVEKVVTDLNLDSDGNIVTGEIPQYDYLGTVTRVYLRDLPNLKARLGGTGITLTMVNDSVKKLLISAETYLYEIQYGFVGYRWARVTGNAIGTDENDIYWPIRICEDINDATQDTDATYKLIRVEAHFN